MWDRKELKAKGKAAFKKNYWPSVLVAVIVGILTGGAACTQSGNMQQVSQSISESNMSMEELMTVLVATLLGGLLAIVIAVLIDIFVTNPLTVGGYRFFVRNSQEEKPSLGLLVSAYKEGRFGRVFLTMFLRDLFLFLWTLLLIVPGLVKSYSYRMVPYLLADHPEMSATEIITLSRQMMKGNKWRAFVLDLSFIGWFLLTAITFGLLGIFYVNPYFMATNAELYQALKDQTPAKEA